MTSLPALDYTANVRKLLALLPLLVAVPAAADDFKIQPGAFGGPRKLGEFSPRDAEAPPVAGAGAKGGKSRAQIYDPRKVKPDAPMPMPAMAIGPAKDRDVASFEPPPPPPEDAPKKVTVPDAAPDPVKAKARVTEYLKGMENKDVEKPPRWRFLGLGLVGVLLTVPFLRVAWRRFSHEHQMEGAVGSVPADIAAQRRDLGSAERLIPVSDKALNVVRRAGGWVSSSRVGVQIGVEPEEAEQLLDLLHEEGRLERKLDDEGRALFLFVARA